MVTVQEFFYIFIIALTLLAYGRHFEDYTSGILGGFMMFLLGTWLLINPITAFTGFLNTAIGTVLFAMGCYIWIFASIDVLKSKGMLS